MDLHASSPAKHPLQGGMDHAFDQAAEGPVKQLRRPGDSGADIQSAANNSPQVKQLKASEAAANTAVVQRKAANETGLPDYLKAGIESLSGFSLDHVRVVYNSSKPAEVGAWAYAEGSVIHVAPGQEHHLPEEAWHIVQQMQGKVKATTVIAGAKVNDDAALEREASEMGAKAANLPAEQTTQEVPKSKQVGPETRVKQLKSRFTALKNESNIKTPIQALSDQAKEYFDAVKMSESYRMHGGKYILPADYADNYVRAQSATAIIEKASLGKNGDRDNTVIGPYGHFGWMERSIMGRDDISNLYDGGHLIERSLMEGADADCHGNLAPQEGKEFNQDLMRGWEHIPEKYQHSLDFTYSVQVDYPDKSYTRTGAQLIEAGVIPSGLFDKLESLESKRGDEFKKKVFTFPRWVPHQWHAEIDAGEDKEFPKKNFNKGSHYNKLVGSEEEARREVFEKDPGNPSEGPLVSNSGVVSGWIPNLEATQDQKRFFVGGTRKINAKMFSGFPQPLDLQKKRDRKIKAKAKKLKIFNGKVKILKNKFSLGRLARHIEGVRVRSAGKKRKVLKDTTILAALRESNEIATLRNRVGATPLSNFVKRIKAAQESDPKFKLTTSLFQDLSKSYFPESGKSFAQAIVFDPNFKEEVIDEEELPEEEVESKTEVSNENSEIVEEEMGEEGEDLIIEGELDENDSNLSEEDEVIDENDTSKDEVDIDEEL